MLSASDAYLAPKDGLARSGAVLSSILGIEGDGKRSWQRLDSFPMGDESTLGASLAADAKLILVGHAGCGAKPSAIVDAILARGNYPTFDIIERRMDHYLSLVSQIMLVTHASSAAASALGVPRSGECNPALPCCFEHDRSPFDRHPELSILEMPPPETITVRLKPTGLTMDDKVVGLRIDYTDTIMLRKCRVSSFLLCPPGGS